MWFESQREVFGWSLTLFQLTAASGVVLLGRSRILDGKQRMNGELFDGWVQMRLESS